MADPRSWARRRWRLIVALLAVAALAAVLVARRLRGPLVPVARVVRVDLRRTVVASGRVLAPARIKLGSLVLGRVRSVSAAEGQAVARGALLVQLDDDEAKAALARARAEVARARARLHALRHVSRRLSQQSVQRRRLALDEAEATLRRQRALAKAKVATGVDLERAERARERARSSLQSALTQALDTKRGGAGYRAALAGLAAAQAAEKAAEIRLAQLRLSAPCAGVIVSREVEPGDVVPAGATLLELARSGAKQILIEPDERNLALLAVGQRGVASTDARPQQRFDVRVATIVPAVDRATGTFRVKLAVPGAAAEGLVTDMTVSTEIVVGVRRKALSLPRSAVRELAGARPFALVLHRGRVVRRALRLGLRGERRVEVLAGVEPGETVVLATEQPLAAGDAARPAPASRDEVGGAGTARPPAAGSGA